MKVWLRTTLERQYPLGPTRGAASLTLPAARGESLSFQVCAAADPQKELNVEAAVSASPGLQVTIRRVGHTPMPHRNTGTAPEECEGWEFQPGLVPDPLFPDSSAMVGPGEIAAFWITIVVAPSTRPGAKRVDVKITPEKGAAVSRRVVVNVSKATIDPRKRCNVGHWLGCDSIMDYYKVEPWSKAFWPLCEAYMKNYAAHGGNIIHTPVFTPPTDGVKRPTQLLRVTPLPGKKYRFDWRRVKQYVDLARRSGCTDFMWTHFFTQWGCQNAIRIYEERGKDHKLLWPHNTGGTSKTYRNFLAQYLPALKRFLDAERITKKSVFCVSDEPHGDGHLKSYRACRGLLKDLAPWIKVCDAVSDIRFGRERITDCPIPAVSHAPAFLAEDIPCWTYYCCGPRGPYINRLFETPLNKIRMLGWVMYRLGIDGFLHWGYNYWYKHCTQEIIDPFTVADGGRWPLLAYGDPFVVYPGPDGPIDSLRWEVFAESMQDYTLLNTLDVDPNAARLRAITDFKDFPRQREWILHTRTALLKNAPK